MRDIAYSACICTFPRYDGDDGFTRGCPVHDFSLERQGDDEA